MSKQDIDRDTLNTFATFLINKVFLGKSQCSHYINPDNGSDLWHLGYKHKSVG